MPRFRPPENLWNLENAVGMAIPSGARRQPAPPDRPRREQDRGFRVSE